MEGVREELVKAGHTEESADKYLALFTGLNEHENDGLEYIAGELGEYLDSDIKDNLSEIITAVEATKAAEFKTVFDPTLVRGMSYYTGTIFEIAIPEFGGSCGGGGRYDKMVGQFTGQDTPACGFSIGFERIVLLLLENGFEIPGDNKKIAFLIEKGIDSKRLSEIMIEAANLRKEGYQVLVSRMNKNKKFQRTSLEEQGYTEFKDFYREALKN